MKKITSLALLPILPVFLFTLLSSFITEQHNASTPARWEKLGERKVNFKVDRDEILIGAREGFFDALKIKVRKGAINIHRMVVHFGNGETKEVELRSEISAGGETRVIDLPGNNRIITKVVFVYDTKNYARRRAEVELWGRH